MAISGGGLHGVHLVGGDEKNDVFLKSTVFRVSF